MKIIKSFSFAIEGLKTAFKQEVNFKVHTFVTLAVIIAALFLQFNTTEWIILLLTIAFVVVLELINTSIEAVVNLVEPEIKEQAKIAKDVSAASVMISAITAIVVGVLLFTPKLIALLS